MKALTRRQDGPTARLGHAGRKRRMAQAGGALVATLAAAVLVLELVGTFSSGVPLPRALVILQSHQLAGPVGSGRGQRYPTEPATAIVKSVPKIIEGGDTNDESSTVGAAGEGDTSTTTSTTVAAHETALSTTTVTRAPVTTTTAPRPSTGEDNGGSDTTKHLLSVVTTTQPSRAPHSKASDDVHNDTSVGSRAGSPDGSHSDGSGTSTAGTFGGSGSRKHSAGADGSHISQPDN
jgi:hypothetical protein